MKLNLILLEDEIHIAESLIYAFEREGFHVMHYGTCEAARVALTEDDFDIAIFDVGLPDGSGFDLCKKVRKFSELPILFLTARSDEVDKVVGLEIGGDDYVTKPFSPREVVARVKAIIRRSKPMIPQTAPEQGLDESSEILFNAETIYDFLLKGQALGLTRSEYEILAILFGQMGRVFTREQLLEKISIDQYSVMDRVIDAHIKSIRAKLREQEANSAEWIRTKRGIGYFLHISD